MKLKAFTLVELMVVMAIIAFLSVGAYGGLTYALRQGRDTQRIRIADQVQTALQAYYADYQKYPGGSCAAVTGPSITSAEFPTGLKTCAGAFSTLSTSLVNANSPEGLRDYFESEFKWGPLDSAADTSDNSLKYYFQPSVSGGEKAIKFTVCTQLENKKGGASVTSRGNKDMGCYCVGASQSLVACIGML